MHEPNLPTFRSFLVDRFPKNSMDQEILIHDLGATIQRRNKIAAATGFDRLNTGQLAAFLCMNDNLRRHDFLREALVISAAIDGAEDLVDHAMTCGLIPDSWSWLEAARTFAGTTADLKILINHVTAIRERSAIACLAGRRQPDAIDRDILMWFHKPATGKVFHRLAMLGLDGANGGALADYLIKAFDTIIDSLLAGDLDATLARIVKRCTVDNVAERLAAHPRCIGDHTRLALAEHEIRRNRYQQAIDLAGGTRLLSPVFPSMAVIGTLALIELRQWSQAAAAADRIEDPDVRSQCRVRIAQGTNDTAGELDELVSLNERHPDDPANFVQLLLCLEKIGKPEVGRQLCFQRQEAFLDHPEVMAIIQRYTGSATSNGHP